MSALFLAVAVIIAILLYFLPAIVADSRDHQNKIAVCALNLLLGWTFVGWVVAMVWALKESDKPAKSSARPALDWPAATKACPFCAEQVLVAAKVCKHCQRDIPPAADSVALL